MTWRKYLPWNKEHWCEEEELVRNLINGKVSDQVKWAVNKVARAAVKDYLQDIREAEAIAAKVRNGEIVNDGELNFLNLFKADHQ